MSPAYCEERVSDIILQMFYRLAIPAMDGASHGGQRLRCGIPPMKAVGPTPMLQFFCQIFVRVYAISSCSEIKENASQPQGSFQFVVSRDPRDAVVLSGGC